VKHSSSRSARDDIYKDALIRAMIINGESFGVGLHHTPPFTSSDQEEAPDVCSVITISDICESGFHLRFKHQYRIEVRKNQQESVYDAIDERYGIDLFASSLDELEELIKEQFCMMWNQYIREDETRLGPKARIIVKKLKELIEEVS